jgi:hypothetical protein
MIARRTSNEKCELISFPFFCDSLCVDLMTDHDHGAADSLIGTSASASVKGFWGQRTSSVNFCEDDYVVSYYVAEWYNTLSSLAIVFVAVFCFFKSRQLINSSAAPWMLHAIYFVLFLCGWGRFVSLCSFLFD